MIADGHSVESLRDTGSGSSLLLHSIPTLNSLPLIPGKPLAALLPSGNLMLLDHRVTELAQDSFSAELSSCRYLLTPSFTYTHTLSSTRYNCEARKLYAGIHLATASYMSESDSSKQRASTRDHICQCNHGISVWDS